MRRLAWAAVVAAVLAGCGSGGGHPAAVPTQRVFPPAPEPARAPVTTVAPAGQTLALPAGSAPEGVAVDPRTGLAAVALRNPARVALVDVARARVVRIVGVPGAARHLELAAPGGPVLLPAEDTDRLVELRLPAGTVERDVPVGRQPHDAAAAGGQVVVADELGGAISFVRGGAVSKVLLGPVQPGGVAAAGDRAAVVDVGAALLWVVDGRTDSLVAVLKAGDGPTHAVAIGGDRVAVADTRGDAILVYDLAGTPRPVGRVPLAGAPYGLAADTVRHRLWVGLTASNRLAELTLPAAGLPTPTGRELPAVRQPNSLGVLPSTGRVVVAGADDGRLQLVDP